MTLTSAEEGRTNVNPDKIIAELGGCGRYQIRMSVIVHLIKTIVCFSTMNLIISTSSPTWYCKEQTPYQNVTSCVDQDLDSDSYCKEKECKNVNGTNCDNIEFETGLNTIVNEFSLICDLDFIPSTISSIQIAGVLAGNVISGQLADLFGRKPTFFASILFIFVSHLVSFFSTTWQMFAACVFFSGVGGGFFLTTQYCLLSEFSLAKWRVWIVGFPSWPIQSCIFALLAWLIHDWRYFQLITAILATPCFLAWFVIPESFRWYVAHDKHEAAKNIVNDIAKYNGRDDFNADEALPEVVVTQKRRYTFVHLFKSRFLVRITLLLMLNWCALGVVAYGIAFGIQTLSGNIYLNLFVFNVVGIPSKTLALWLQNRIGRRNSSILCSVVVAIGGLTAGIVQSLDEPNKDIITKIFALIANIGITTAWGPVQTMTIELYPTVIRNIGFGTLSLIGRIGAIIGPQLVYLDTYTPGLLFYVCGGIAVLCVFGTFFLPETKDGNLRDKIKHDNNHLPAQTLAMEELK